MTLTLHRVGSGPSLLLLHPLGADRHVWDPILAPLAVQRTVITLDLPGFGESPLLTGVTPTPRALAAAVAEALGDDGSTDGRPHVAGNSLGGWVALELGLSGAAASVAAIAPAGLWPEPLVPKASITHYLARALGPAATTAARCPATRRVLLAGSVAHPNRVPGTDAARLVRAYGRSPGFVAVNDAMRAGRFESLAEIRVPVTLLWPDHDRLIERPLSIPEAVHNVVLVDAGHMPMWDAPDQVVAALLAASAEGVDGDAGARGAAGASARH